LKVPLERKYCLEKELILGGMPHISQREEGLERGMKLPVVRVGRRQRLCLSYDIKEIHGKTVALPAVESALCPAAN
jgi:hypothetical protein